MDGWMDQTFPLRRAPGILRNVKFFWWGTVVTNMKSGRKTNGIRKIGTNKKISNLCWGGGALKCARSEISRKGHGESAATLCIF